MERQNEHPVKNTDGKGASPKNAAYSGPLTFREATKQDVAYIMDLARREIGIVPKRLHKHKTAVIYRDGNLIGFISYCRAGGNYLYMYLLAFEKEAQNQGYAYEAGKWMFFQENALEPVYGIFSRVHKTNQAALHASLQKYGHQVIKESPRYFLLFGPVRKKSSHGD
jgi:hypothetical protein